MHADQSASHFAHRLEHPLRPRIALILALAFAAGPVMATAASASPNPSQESAPKTSPPPEAPPPDPIPPPIIAGAAVCAGVCILGAVGSAAGIAAGPAGIPLPPLAGLAAATLGGAVAEHFVPDRPETSTDEELWGAVAGAGGFLSVGAAGAAVGYFLGAQTSVDAPIIGGGFGAIGLGLIGGAAGAGAAVFAATTFQAPPCFW